MTRFIYLLFAILLLLPCFLPAQSEGKKAWKKLNRQQRAFIQQSEPIKVKPALVPDGAKVYKRLSKAHEDFVFGGPEKALVLVYHDSARWSRRAVKELFEDERLASFFTSGQYSLVILDAGLSNKDVLEEFFGNVTFPVPNQENWQYYNAKTALIPGFVRFPAFFVVRFNHPLSQDDRVIACHWGYLKPRQLKKMLNGFEYLTAVPLAGRQF